jgi:hypothetical protein
MFLSEVEQNAHPFAENKQKKLFAVFLKISKEGSDNNAKLILLSLCKNSSWAPQITPKRSPP